MTPSRRLFSSLVIDSNLAISAILVSIRGNVVRVFLYLDKEQSMQLRQSRMALSSGAPHQWRCNGCMIPIRADRGSTQRWGGAIAESFQRVTEERAGCLREIKKAEPVSRPYQDGFVRILSSRVKTTKSEQESWLLTLLRDSFPIAYAKSQDVDVARSMHANH